MPRFRRKPTEIEAVQFDGTAESARALNDFSDGYVSMSLIGDRVLVSVETPSGDVLVEPGDWIVEEGPDDYRPVKPDVFAATYEPVEEPAHG